MRVSALFFSFWGTLAIALLVTLCRIYYLGVTPFDLYADEAQYWTWAKFFDFGYYSKPPMVAWLIALSTHYCGDGAFCVRLASPIVHGLTALLVYGIGAKLYDAKVGFWSAVTYLTLPGVSLSAILISTDPPLLFFWALAIFSFIYAMEGWRDQWWAVSGIAAGLGLLSKYTMVFFFPSALWYMLSSHEGRLYLKSSAPWFGLLFALLLFLPNLLWNYSNHFVSFFHTMDNANFSGFSLHPENLAIFIAGQAGVFGPILLAVLAWQVGHVKPLFKNEKDRLLLCFIIPFLAAIAVISLLSRAHANWAAPVYIPATVLTVSWLLGRGKQFLLIISLILHVSAAVLFHSLDPIIRLSGLELAAHTDPFRRVRGWQEFGAQAVSYLNAYPGTILLSDERKTVAQLMYLLRTADGRPYTVMKWNADRVIQDHYDLTTDMNYYKGNDFLLISREQNPSLILPYFKSYRLAGTIALSHYRDPDRAFSVYYLKGFKGY